MARGILLDTSTWICDLRARGWDNLKLAVQQVLTVEQVYTCWVVMAELLIGARDERGFTQLFETLRALPENRVTDRVWEAVTRLGYILRRRGVTIIGARISVKGPDSVQFPPLKKGGEGGFTARRPEKSPPSTLS